MSLFIWWCGHTTQAKMLSQPIYYLSAEEKAILVKFSFFGEIIQIKFGGFSSLTSRLSIHLFCISLNSNGTVSLVFWLMRQIIDQQIYNGLVSLLLLLLCHNFFLDIERVTMCTAFISSHCQFDYHNFTNSLADSHLVCFASLHHQTMFCVIISCSLALESPRGKLPSFYFLLRPWNLYFY